MVYLNMPVTQEVNLAKNLVRTSFHTFPTCLAIVRVYINKPGESVSSEFHNLFYCAKVYGTEILDDNN